MPGVVRGIFGGTSRGEERLQEFNPAGFRAPGLTGSFSGNSFNIARTSASNRALRNVVGGFEDRAAGFRGLRDQVTPGFGRLTRARVEAIRNARGRAVGNLREELGRRRVLGSSFAQREIAGVEASFGQQEELARAESFIGELGLNTELLNQETAASINAATTVLNQLNLETNLAANLSAAASTNMNANLTAQAQAAAAQQESTDSFLAAIGGFIFGG